MSKNESLTIEQKIERLEKTVAWFDSEDFVLEQAIEQYEKAQRLADEIKDDIAALKNTIEQIKPTE